MVNVPSVNNSYKWAGGGIVSSVEDLLIFGLLLCQCYSDLSSTVHGVLTKQVLEQFWTPVDNTQS